MISKEKKKKKGLHRLWVSSRTKKIYYSGPNNGKFFTTSAPESFGGGLFSFLEQKSVSKALKTCYFAYFSGQWGVRAPPIPPLATLLINWREQWYANLQYIFCLFVHSEQTHYFKIGKFCVFMMYRPKLNVKWQVTQTGGQSGLQLSPF